MSPGRSDAGVWRRATAGALLTVLAVASLALAGDEVDYSAPYVVVENGELVTKYPAKEHEAGGDDVGRPGKTWVIAAAAAGLAIALLAYARRRSRNASADDRE